MKRKAAPKGGQVDRARSNLAGFLRRPAAVVGADLLPLTVAEAVIFAHVHDLGRFLRAELLHLDTPFRELGVVPSAPRRPTRPPG